MRRKHAMLMVALLMLVTAPLHAHEQEKPAAEKREKAPPAEKAAREPKPPVPLAITLVFTEYERDKKISSLPYTMPVNAQVVSPNIAVVARGSYGRDQLRMGVRVPIVTTSTKDTNVTTTQYMDVGTDIDCAAWTRDGIQFVVEVQAERSSIYASKVGEGKRVEWSPAEELYVGAQPIIRRYRSTMTLLLRDGQTIQRSMATDPVSGRVLKVDVTLNVVK